MSITPLDCDDPALKPVFISVEEALERLQAGVKPIRDVEMVPLADGLLRVLAEPVLSTINVPPADNSSMDGYAINTRDLNADQSPVTLPVSQRIPAGSVPEPLKKGSAARIFTGAAVPAGADAVVMQEVCTPSDDNTQVQINHMAVPGENIRSAGEDIKAGAEILAAGHRLRAQDLGLLASVGVTDIKVYRKLRVAVFFTGDELRHPGEPLETGQIYNSNQFTLSAMLTRMGCEVINLGIVRDSFDATVEALRNAAASADLVMTSGGVSVGEEDHVKAALSELGSLDLWSIAIKPGKPLAYGQVDGVPFIGLPGNPVSVFATACIVARPYILAMQGMSFSVPGGLRIKAGFAVDKPVRRKEYIRVRVEADESGQPQLIAFANQSSGVLTSASWADGFAVLEIGEGVQQGDLLEYLPFSEFDL